MPWSEVGLRPAEMESPAIGPDHLALGAWGAWAVWDTVNHRIVSSVGIGADQARTLTLPAVDDLAFSDAGAILVLVERELMLLPGPLTITIDSIPLPDLVPTGVSLAVEEGVAVGIDAFGNRHPIAQVHDLSLSAYVGPKLLPPPYAVRVDKGVVYRDLAPVASEALAATLVGDCVLVERGKRGSVTDRAVLCNGVEHPLPPPGVYRPVDAIGVGPEGAIGWLDPQPDGLHIVRATR